MIAQFLYEDEEAKDGIGDITVKITGTKEQEEKAKWLWEVTLDLSTAVFRKGNTKDNLREEGYEDEEIKRIMEAYPNLISTEPLTAYEECVDKLKEWGLKTEWIDDTDNVDVWTSIGVY